MDAFDDLARMLGIDPNSPEERLGQALALEDDDFLENLVKLRREKKLTQQEVANRMKRDKSAVSRFENLGSDPRLSTIRRYARAIGALVTHSVDDWDLDPSAMVGKTELKTRYFTKSEVKHVARREQPEVDTASYRKLGTVSA